MDRYVRKEPRVGLDYPQENQMMQYAISNPRRSNNIGAPEGVWYGGTYGADFPYVQPVRNIGYMGVAHANAPSFTPMTSEQVQIMSGIDPSYLAGYETNINPTYITTGQPIQRESTPVSANSLGSNYQNRSFVGVDRNNKSFSSQSGGVESPHEDSQWKKKKSVEAKKDFLKATTESKNIQTFQTTSTSAKVPAKKPLEIDPKKSETQIVSRLERLKALYKSGPRAFSGPVEKVLKWHKALMNMGVMVYYEVVAKLVSVRKGDSCSKILVIRDENGPAMQVVYYEIDFLLPVFKLPCTVRVIGRMCPGTCRLQAFNVRTATGDDVATLSRRAAVTIHHVTKLCTEYGFKFDKM